MTAINTQQLLALTISQDYKRWPVVTMNNEFAEYHQYVKYVLDQLELQLLHNKYVVIGIDNGNNNVVEELTLKHDFILYRNGASSVIKLEHYMPFYQSCIGNAENWRSNLMSLLTSTTGSDRLMLWNDIFSARERRDNNNSLRIRVHIDPLTIRRSPVNSSIDINHKRMLSYIKDSIGYHKDNVRGTSI